MLHRLNDNGVSTITYLTYIKTCNACMVILPCGLHQIEFIVWYFFTIIGYYSDTYLIH